MIVSVPKETVPGERRVALVPELAAKLHKTGLDVCVEPGAGVAAGFLDPSYQQQGARLQTDALREADIVLKVQPPALRRSAD